MLFDLTAISGQRVSQVDELHVGGRQWVPVTGMLLALGGAAMGAGIATLIRMTLAPGAWWPFLAAPICAAAAVILFGRRRSMEGEATQRRIERMFASRTRMDGRFIRPGSLEPFDPNGFTFIETHDHPIDR